MFASLTGDYDSGVLFDTPNRELAINQMRWTSPDPAGAGWNQYAYPTNPNSATDPTGLYAWYDGPGNDPSENFYGLVTGTAGGCSSSCGLASGQVSFGNASVAADEVPKGAVSVVMTTEYGTAADVSWDTNGNLLYDYNAGLVPNSPVAPIEIVSHNDAGDLLFSMFNAPGAFVNNAVCSGNGYCTVGLGIGLVLIGAVFGEVVPDIQIPDWVGTSFEDAEYSTVVLQEDTTVFRAETYAFPSSTGSFFGTEMPTSVADANELYNITAANPANQMNYVNTYVVPAGTTVVYGPVAGGTGMQMWVPSTSGITQTGTQLLP